MTALVNVVGLGPQRFQPGNWPIQPNAIVTPGLTLASPLTPAALPPFGPVSAEPGSQIIVDWTKTYQTWPEIGARLGCSHTHARTLAMQGIETIATRLRRAGPFVKAPMRNEHSRS